MSVVRRVNSHPIWDDAGRDGAEPPGMPGAMQSPPAVPRCAVCDDVIGVYEPAIAVLGGVPREISRAAEPRFPFDGARCYHLGCYASPEHQPSEGPA
jgi:hypothetical protein